MWDKKTVRTRDLTPYITRDHDQGLSSRLAALYEQQKRSWPQFRRGHEAMKKAQVQTIQLGGCWVRCQYTPHRFASVSARVDPRSIARRSCFLCPENLYPREKGLPYGEDYFILCNVSPIFDFHLVITHQDHLPQQIEGHFDTVLELARDISPHFVLIYNGPRCGASAPDHLHFQAFPGENLPLESQAWAVHPHVVQRDQILIGAPPGFSRRFLTLESDSSEVLSLWFHQSLVALAEMEESFQEPMINFVMGYQEGRWRMVLFPRRKHRPRCYHRRGDQQMLISPGAIDMAGVFVIPRKKDYERLNAKTLHHIYQEVTTPEDRFSRLVEKLREINETGTYR